MEEEMWGLDDDKSEAINQTAQNKQISTDLLGTTASNTIKSIANDTDVLANTLIGNIENDNIDTNEEITPNISSTIKNVNKKAQSKREFSREEKFYAELFNNEGLDLNFTPTPDTPRRKRYSICKKIPELNFIAQRIHKAYVDNILIKNAQTKKYLNWEIREDKKLVLQHMKNVSKEFLDVAEKLTAHFNTQERFKKDVSDTLIFGDKFVEIFDLSILNKLNKSTAIITENTEIFSKKKLNVQDVKKLKRNIGIIMESTYDGDPVVNQLDTCLIPSSKVDSLTESSYDIRTISVNGKEKHTQTLSVPFIFENNYCSHNNLNNGDNNTQQRILFESEMLTKVDGNKKEEKGKHPSILTESENFIKENQSSLETIKNLEENIKRRALKIGGEQNVVIQESEQTNLDNLAEQLKKLDNHIGSTLPKKDKILENENHTNWGFDFNDLIKGQTENEEVFKISDIHKVNLEHLNNLLLKEHDPENVIIIESQGIKYGYLVIDKIDESSGANYIDSFKRFTNGLVTQGTNNKDQVNSFIEDFTKVTLDKVRTSIEFDKLRQGDYNGKQFFDNFSVDEKVSRTLKIAMFNHLDDKKPFKFRFVSVDKMAHYYQDKDKYYPYGTSVMDPLVSPVKLYTLSMMAGVVNKLSRASITRKWTINATDEQKNHEEMVQSLTHSIKNKSTNFDSLSNLENISNIITDYKDMAVISNNGQPVVDMEIVPMQDRGVSQQDSEEYKQDIISAGGVPSIYLNIVDNADLREALVNLNISFANNVISKQSDYEQTLNHFFSIIYKFLLAKSGFKTNFYFTSYCEIKLNAPLVLQIQSDEALITVVTNIIDLIKRLEIAVDPIALFKTYMPTTDWDKIIKDGESYMAKLGKEALINKNTEQSSGGMF